VDGVSISWQGTATSHPTDPTLNWAYYNETDGVSYIYDGSGWEILTQDGGDDSSDFLGRDPLFTFRRVIEQGEQAIFVMGDDSDSVDDNPEHEVRLSRGYSMGVHEVTNSQFAAVMNEAMDRGWVEVSNDYLVNTEGIVQNLAYVADVDGQSLTWYGQLGLLITPGLEEHPVTKVTWYGAMAFTHYLNRIEGREVNTNPLYWTWDDSGVWDSTRGGYRLPTEAEWEYAARGGANIDEYMYAGGDTIDDVGWDLSNSNLETQPVGRKLSNALGLYDMTGNVEELCIDDYFADLTVYEALAVDGVYPDLALHGGNSASNVRGGAYTFPAASVAKRFYANRVDWATDRGFRVVLGEGWLPSPGDLLPEDGSIVFDPTPQLDWQNVVNAITYEVQTGVDDPAVEGHPTTVVHSSEYTYPTEMALGSTLYWRVRAVGAGNRIGAWSETRSVDYAAYAAYAVGETGPAGGYIFYDDEADGVDDIPGVRYLEAAPSDIEVSGGYEHVWGGYGTEVGVGAQGRAIGTGASNTAAIVAAYGASDPYNNTGNYAARLADQYEYGGYDDWFLPSRDELNLMYTELHNGDVGGFASSGYWSSSEYDSSYAWYQYFYNGTQYSTIKYYTKRVRACRAF